MSIPSHSDRLPDSTPSDPRVDPVANRPEVDVPHSIDQTPETMRFVPYGAELPFNSAAERWKRGHVVKDSAAARAAIRELRDELPLGYDGELISIGAELTVFHLERGAARSKTAHKRSWPAAGTESSRTCGAFTSRRA